MVRNRYYFNIYLWYFSENWIIYTIVYLSTMILLFLPSFRLKFLPSFFSQILNPCFFCIFCLSFWGSQRITLLIFSYFDLHNHPLYHICWLSHKKNTCPCLLTTQVQLHSSFILPKNFQFVITLWTSQHKDRSLFQNQYVSLLFFGKAK